MNINEKYEKLMKDLNENIKNPKELEYINTKLAKSILEIMKDIDERTTNVENKISKIEEELFVSEDYDEDDGIEIVCPYCNYVFETYIEELKTEVVCPECKNVIELDWNYEEGCHGDCSCCHENDDCEDDEE